MPLFSLIDDFSDFVRALTDRYTVEDITHETGISIEKLEQWRRGGNHYRPQAEWLLYGFCVNRRDFDLLGPVLPTFDRQGPFDLDAPPLGDDIEPPRVQLCNRPTKIAGHTVNFPFGIGGSERLQLFEQWSNFCFALQSCSGKLYYHSYGCE